MLYNFGIFVLGAICIMEAQGEISNPANPDAQASVPPPGMSSQFPLEDLSFDVTDHYGDASPRLASMRNAALQANPDLAAESKSLEDEEKVWQDKFDQETIKMDPNMASIVPKMALAREIGEAANKGTPLQVDVSKVQMSPQD